MSHGDIREALESSIAKLGVPPEFAVWLASARSLANSLDADPVNEKLWREFRLVLVPLFEAVAVSEDVTAALLRELEEAGSDGG